MTSQNVYGALPANSTSKITEALRSHRALSVLALIGLGLLGYWLHQSFRWPLHLPGHHGIEWLAILTFARLVSPERFAATLVALSAGAAALALGPHNPWALVQSGVVGLAFDALFLAGGRGQTVSNYYIVASGGLAYAVKPLSQGLMLWCCGLPADSMAAGVAYPLLTHLGFGVVGAALGLTLANASGNWSSLAHDKS